MYNEAFTSKNISKNEIPLHKLRFVKIICSVGVTVISGTSGSLNIINPSFTFFYPDSPSSCSKWFGCSVLLELPQVVNHQQADNFSR